MGAADLNGKVLQQAAKRFAAGAIQLIDLNSRIEGEYVQHDIGQALGKPAHMRFLLRTRAGAFGIDRAVTLEEAMDAAKEGPLDRLLLPLDYPLQALPALCLPEAYWKLGRNGGKLPRFLLPGLAEGQRCRVYAGDELLGVARRAGDLLRFDVGLAGGA